MSAKLDAGAFVAVVDADGRILTVRERKPSRRFGLPGGRIERGESPEDAAVRECLEETGLNVVVSNLIGRYEFIDGSTAHVFRCEVVAGVEASEVGSEVAWYEPGNIPRPHRRSLQHGLADLLAGRSNVVKTDLP